MDVYTPATLERTVHIPFHYVNNNMEIHVRKVYKIPI